MSSRVAMTSATSATRLGEREQPWRGKYLRALNICPPSEAPALLRRKSLGALTMRARLRAQRSWREPDNNSKSRSGLRTSRRSLGADPRGVSFAATARAWQRRQPEDEAEEQVSLPIEIPQPARVELDDRLLDRRRHSAHSLRKDASVAGTSASNGLTNTGTGTDCSDELDGFVEDDGWDDEDEEGEAEDEEGEAEDEAERAKAPDEDIFAMEEDLDAGSLSLSRSQAPLLRHPELEPELDEYAYAYATRSLRRAASENVLQLGRHHAPSGTSGSSRGRHHLRGVHEQEADEMARLPDSFVPPHEMIERDCFSLGLRDEFKRRPDHNI